MTNPNHHHGIVTIHDVHCQRNPLHWKHLGGRQHHRKDYQHEQHDNKQQQWLRVAAVVIDRLSLGRLSLGRLSLGRLSLGRLSLGRLSLGRLSLGRLLLGRLLIELIVIGRLFAEHTTVPHPLVSLVVFVFGG